MRRTEDPMEGGGVVGRMERRRSHTGRSMGERKQQLAKLYRDDSKGEVAFSESGSNDSHGLKRQSLKRSLLLLSTVICLVSCNVPTLASAKDNATKGVASSTTPLTSTSAYDESIRWSFGGWAPMGGGQKQKLASSNAFNGTSSTTSRQIVSTEQASVGARASQQNSTNAKILKTRQQDSMSESASSTNDQIHFAAGPYNQQQQQHQLQNGPAYALPAMQKPMQFSLPAPTPIVREHLLQASNHNQASFNNRPQQQPHQGYPPIMMARPAGPHHQPPRQLARPHHMGPKFAQLDQQHRNQHHQHMLNHQRHLMMMERQRSQQQAMRHPAANMMQPSAQWPHFQPMQRPAQQHRQPHMVMEQGPRTMPRYPGSPIIHKRPVEQQPQQHHHQQVGTFKVIEGEQPLLFTTSLSHERIPMIEVSGANKTAHNEYQQQQPETSTDATFASTMAAIEKDNLNYHNALKQVQSNYEPGEQEQQQQSPQSNNIQEIKQQQQQGYQKQEQKAAADKSQPNYLTIPVAVETEGDKVLTADDIDEIEKHVIDVLPNLKTADKVVKLADAHLTLSSLKSSLEEQQRKQPSDGPSLHQSHYEEHKSTMKQLEADLKQPPAAADYSPPEQQPVSVGSAAAPGTLNQATTAHAQHQAEDQHQNADYYVAAGPMQELSQIEPEQMADYNLIKNDLLSNFRYEPTRASAKQQQTASTPPMPYTAGQESLTPARVTSGGRASVTRYFHQGQPSGHSGQAGGKPAGLFARLNGQRAYSPTATTQTILGGRKVSEVMRPLIHTTPVPMTSPLHLAHVDPEKVDAIQLIGGRANDKQPMVVEAHQLVQHSPEGGIDYSSGMHPSAYQPEADSQQAHNQTGSSPHSFAPGEMQQNNEQGAIIEYVALDQQALNNALNQQHGQQEQPASANQGPEVEQVYVNHQEASRGQEDRNQQISSTSKSPFLYDYTMSTQQQQQVGGAEPPRTYIVSGSPAEEQQVGAGKQPQLAVWSPSVASEHQQQQLELSEHAGQMQQIDMPSTAGYNFFQAQQSSSAQPAGQQEQYVIEQQQQAVEQPSPSKWRTKAGGSQPNPDAQYDGQIAKPVEGAENQEQEAQNNQQSGQEQYPIYGASGERQPVGKEQQQVEQQSSPDGYQQQYQLSEQQMSTPPVPPSQATDGQYLMSTNGFVAGAQMNHQAPSEGDYSQLGYMKLDRERQQAHLAQHQAQHQAQLAKIMNNQQQQQSSTYQTTTPISSPPSATEQVQPEAEGQGNGYASLEQSQPAVQSQPEGAEQQQEEHPAGEPGPPQMHSSHVLDQQSLISEPSHSSNEHFSDDDGAKQHQQPAGVYQVYQAYYAPKDHKPLPGYVRLSLEEFNELFRDAEIQYVDRNMNGLTEAVGQAASQLPVVGRNQANQEQGQQHAYEQPASDMMRAAASDSFQSILVDGRSISSERRSSSSAGLPLSEAHNATSASLDRKPSAGSSKLGQAVKKIISIRNSRHLAKQSKSGIMKKVSSQAASSSTTSTPIKSTRSETTTPQSLTGLLELSAAKQARAQETSSKSLLRLSSPAKKRERPAEAPKKVSSKQEEKQKGLKSN